jgi:hypothetical protein
MNSKTYKFILVQFLFLFSYTIQAQTGPIGVTMGSVGYSNSDEQELKDQVISGLTATRKFAVIGEKNLDKEVRNMGNRENAISDDDGDLSSFISSRLLFKVELTDISRVGMGDYSVSATVKVYDLDTDAYKTSVSETTGGASKLFAIKALSQKIIDKIYYEFPIKTKVVAADKKTVRLDAGKRAGVKQGMVFNFYDDLLGELAGDFEVYQVQEDYSLAKLGKGKKSDIKKGMEVKEDITSSSSRVSSGPSGSKKKGDELENQVAIVGKVGRKVRINKGIDAKLSAGDIYRVTKTKYKDEFGGSVSKKYKKEKGILQITEVYPEESSARILRGFYGVNKGSIVSAARGYSTNINRFEFVVGLVQQVEFNPTESRLDRTRPVTVYLDGDGRDFNIADDFLDTYSPIEDVMMFSGRYYAGDLTKRLKSGFGATVISYGEDAEITHWIPHLSFLWDFWFIPEFLHFRFNSDLGYGRLRQPIRSELFQSFSSDEGGTVFKYSPFINPGFGVELLFGPLSIIANASYPITFYSGTWKYKRDADDDESYGFPEGLVPYENLSLRNLTFNGGLAFTIGRK